MLPATFGASLLVTWLASVPAWQAITEKSINLLVVAAILFSLWLFIQRMFFRLRYRRIRLKPHVSKGVAAAGITAGVVLGATGVGGGIVVLPMLLRYAKMDIRQAIGTSILSPPCSPALPLLPICRTDTRMSVSRCGCLPVPAQYAADQNPAHADAGSRFSVCHADPYPVQRSDDDTESVLNRNHALCL